MTLVHAPAKVNLLLGCLNQPRPDGYHELRTVFMAVNLIDELICETLPNGRIKVVVSGAQAHLVPPDGSDLAGRAAALLRQRLGRQDLGVRLWIHKAIPVAGGMAGGSADAAAALRGCNDLWGLDADNDTLMTLGAELGADVPFALLGGVALGTNRGDQLTPLPVQGIYHWVFALAKRGLSTAAVFRCFDTINHAPSPNVEEPLLAALASGDAIAVGQSLHNDLTDAACHLRPALANTLVLGRQLDGVLGAVLSGSGPTCAFLCESADAATTVAQTLKSLPQVHDARIAVGPAPGTTVQP
ncbi:MAG: 4-(cytidine 5'-diphospho)-2-C-methyl-D-erythritol kinase [Propionibacteriaceae bacterium]|nr:4-(cytidine 5'-diphospho)-2-C-methyl-D-erythritol kinase [Propionibacteriaceae bacterium]